MADAALLTKLVSREVLTRAVGRALRAPSVHNSQPWQWRISDGVVELHADPDRHLVGTDPDRRDLVISCEAARSSGYGVAPGTSSSRSSTTTSKFGGAAWAACRRPPVT